MSTTSAENYSRDLVSVVRERARSASGRVVVTWLDALRSPAAELTFGSLDEQAGAVAAALVRATDPGDRVLLLYPPGLQFVSAFLGCLYAGRIAVPVYPDLDPEAAETLRRIRDDSGARVALVGDPHGADAAGRLLGLRVLAVGADDRWYPTSPPRPSDVAFLQYTSGSTGAPKGVLVRHGNLVANLEAITAAFGHTPDTRVVSWLPVYHDMGLIGNVLHTLHLGCELYLGSPSEFVSDPLAWLQAVSSLGADTSGGPNFAYELVARTVERTGLPAGLDLSGWRCAYSGAEQVRSSTLERFARAVGPAGFDPASFVPCYGLAEATLLVSAVTPGRGASVGRAVDGAEAVSCGTPRDCRVEVSGADDRVVPDGEVGEILVRGESVSSGYWSSTGATGVVEGSNQAATRRGAADGWLRTGDLGFVVDGDLHVTGRVKDLLIVRGRNIHPQDVEDTATRALRGVRPGAVAAFADPADPEGVVVVAEVRPGASLTGDDLLRLQSAVGAAHGVRVTHLAVAARGEVPKTTSGKLRRSECGRRYGTGAYDLGRVASVGDEPSPTARPTGGATGDEFIAQVAALTADALGDDRAFGWDVSLSLLGMDSLAAVRLKHLLEQRLARSPSLRQLLRGPTVRQLSDQLQALAAAGADAGPGSTGPLHGRPSRAQEALAFLSLLDPTSAEYVISHAVQLPDDLDEALFRQAVRAEFLRHPELGVALTWSGDGLRRTVVPAEELRDGLALQPIPVREEWLAEQLADAAGATSVLTEGPLFRLHLWRTPRRSVLQVAVHHCVADLWSLCLLLRDIAARYSALTAGDEATPVDPPHYDSYVAAQEQYLESDAARLRNETLAARLPRRAAPLGLRTDRPRPARRSSRGARTTTALPDEIDLGPVGGSPVPLLVAVWGLCLHRYGTVSPVVVGVPDAGRPTAALAGVVGLCTNTIPLAVDVHPDQELGELLRDVENQLLAGMEHGLHPLSSVVEAVAPAREPGRLPLIETMVTYVENPLPEIGGLTALLLDVADAPVTVGDLQLRSMAVPRQVCRYDLDLVIARQEDGSHTLVLDYAADLFDEATVDALLGTYVTMLVRARTDEAVSNLFTLSEADRLWTEHVGDSWTQPLAAPVSEILLRAAATAPDSPAVVQGDETLTFDQLGARVQRLARVLQGSGQEVDEW